MTCATSPCRSRGRAVRGTFVVIAALEAERDEVADAVCVAAVALISVLVIASALAWVSRRAHPRAAARAARNTARAITQVRPHAPDPGDREDLTTSPSSRARSMACSTGSRPRFASLDMVVAGQRVFVSDASHEWRTRITIVRGHLELLGDDPDEWWETVVLVMDELYWISRFVDDLLLLAKVEREDFLHPGPMELGALTDEMFEKADGARPAHLAARGGAEGLPWLTASV